jgi:hypothetical protein
MKHLSEKGIAPSEVLFVGASLTVYAFLLLVADPDWLMWAGPVALGAFPITAPGSSLAFDPLEILATASYSVLPGLLALIILASSRGEAHGFRHSTIPGPTAEEGHTQAHGAREHRKAA